MTEPNKVVVFTGSKDRGRGGSGGKGGGRSGGGRPGSDDWQSRLVRTKTGECKATMHNVMLILEHDERLAGLFALDEFANLVMMTRIPPWRGAQAGVWVETAATQLSAWLGQPETYLLAAKSSMVMEAVEATASINRHHPVREYLESLAWDGTERIPTLMADYFGAECNAYTRGVGLIFMISAAARILQPGCKVDTMLVLEGKQGAGKTRVTQMLFGGDRWYMDAQRSPTEKDFYQDLLGKWGVEIGELVSFTRAESNKVKQTLSATSDTYRPSYGRYSRTFARQNVFVGTTNEDQPLRDHTGARRFLPVRVGLVQVDAIATQRDQLWAEAVARYRRGESWWELPEGATDEQDDRYQADVWEGPIARWLSGGDRKYYPERISASDHPADPIGRISAVQSVSIEDILNYALNVPLKDHDRMRQTRVGNIMARWGWQKWRPTIDGQRQWQYMRPLDESGGT